MFGGFGNVDCSDKYVKLARLSLIPSAPINVIATVPEALIIFPANPYALCMVSFLA